MADFTGQNLRRLMSSLGLTTEQVVKRTGLDKRTIKGILDGSNKPHARTITRLAEGLGASADEFFLDPAQLLYRLFDEQTNSAVEEILQSHPDLFVGWTKADFNELHSRFGAGGQLTVDGAKEEILKMNRNRKLHEMLAVLVESNYGDVVRGMIEMMYQKITVEEDEPSEETH